MADADAVHTLRPPAAVLEIADTLERAGHETWCVGGAVRDALLGHPHLDWDLATAATPDEVRTLFGRRRTIPVGIEFGTVGVLDDEKTLHEVTTFRRDVRTDGRHAEVEFGASLDEDLARRDFTINAIAYSPRERRLHDPFEGRRDLAQRVIRAVGDPGQRMREDRLRALRAIRFASRFGFDIDPPTWSAIVDSAPFLGRLSPERVKQELEKTMEQVPRPSVALARWRDAGALHALIPALDAAGAEAIRALDCLAQPGLPRRPNRRLHRLAVLFSDVPPAELGRALTALRCSKMETTWIESLVDRWQRLGDAMAAALQGRGRIPDAQIRRWTASVGRLYLPGFVRIAGARWAARRERGPAPGSVAVHALYRRMLGTAYGDPLDLRDLAVDGDDLRRAGIPAGPEMGRVLQGLLDWVLEDPARNTRQSLLDEARRLRDASAARVRDGR